MNEITTVGVDLAKEVTMVCAANAEGRTRFLMSHGHTSKLMAAERRHYADRYLPKQQSRK